MVKGHNKSGMSVPEGMERPGGTNYESIRCASEIRRHMSSGLVEEM